MDKPLMTNENTEFRSKVLSTLRALKFDRGSKLMIPIYNKEEVVAHLVPLTADFTEEEVKFLAEWREANAQWFPSQFKVTEEGTKKWVQAQVIEAEDRILFWIQALDDSLLGHIGLYRFDFEDRSCEIDNVMRGKQDAMPGIMTMALKSLLNWSFTALGLQALTLRVFSDNERAIVLYQRCGFEKVRDIPLKKVVSETMVQLVERENDSEEKAERYFSQFRITKLKYDTQNK
ncbi:MAG: GNAT family N-acetyltransferase [Candidatus Wildermuthbacteria bacterium]|nr:GNAT family N-acetyltransferase [Candidatus Wildermuthbacteria bacterium]